MNKAIKRRSFLSGAAAGAAGLAASTFPAPAISQGRRQWRMISTFPKGSPGLQKSGERIAKSVKELSQGRLTIKTYGAGELVPALEVFDAVRNNQTEMANSMPYYWTGKDRLAAFFSAAPGGLIAEEQNAWLYHGGGQELWDEFYGGYGLKGFATGSFGSQQIGWFTKEVNSLEDLKGLKMRITGLAGEVLDRLGATTTLLPIGEVMAALQSGTLDAAEFVGGWNDLAFGFHKVAKIYYGPGFHEPGSTEELMVNKAEWDELPEDLKNVVDHACRAENARHSALYSYHQAMALRRLRDKFGVKVMTMPDPVLKAIFETSEEVTAEVGNSSELGRRIYKSWNDYRKARIQFSNNQTLGYLKYRALAQEA
ncbi:MAG: TRAP transporter substrate-binding protein [Gammaproteobacteria bacterium]|nr:TRAP transporter substrate-binding protein [Gammaproteobacteria bacterium]NIR82919.1 TRAP transporter substrate-binding protein [Gammaproteobacteria bacterium]NIR90188.1 TRAP transporter substrate-binding protein [Gammaproteobacteria bacterium]NIU04065.1 TRAP transporter substrate-binding protein [Gammaproteobacteria bacterium]NIV51054.1 ABC transporter substrate-binding protein [Gammaproteobacteria bacterium]